LHIILHAFEGGCGMVGYVKLLGKEAMSTGKIGLIGLIGFFGDCGKWCTR